jgi:hypothetical protein
VCGEGGEFESFTLVSHGRPELVIEEAETALVDDRYDAPVAMLVLKRLWLEPKIATGSRAGGLPAFVLAAPASRWHRQRCHHPR